MISQGRKSRVVNNCAIKRDHKATLQREPDRWPLVSFGAAVVSAQVNPTFWSNLLTDLSGRSFSTHGVIISYNSEYSAFSALCVKAFGDHFLTPRADIQAL